MIMSETVGRPHNFHAYVINLLEHKTVQLVPHVSVDLAFDDGSHSESVPFCAWQVRHFLSLPVKFISIHVHFNYCLKYSSINLS